MRLIKLIVMVLLGTWSCQANPVHWKKQTLTRDFLSEGASAADVDGDGNVDVISGSAWWRGPNFNERFEYREGQPFDPRGYSDHFFSFTADIDRDGDADVIVVGFPGKEATAYLNPGDPTTTARWESHVLADQVSNESPALVDLIAGDLPEIVCSRDGRFGYYQAGADGTKPWQWHGISEDNVTHIPFGHGLGIGDVDGDGRLDILDPTRWWKQPADVTTDQGWEVATWALEAYGGGGAQILVHDVDADGHNDIITSHNAHGYGLSWFAQKVGEDNQRRFIRNQILGQSSVDNPYGVVFSQLHALALADIDQDGFQDIVTGKRWWAHGGNDPGGNQAAVLYWFSGKPDQGGAIPFQPSMVDDDSGVGTEVDLIDLNNDGRMDIISSSKKGVTLHLQVGHPSDDGDLSSQDATSPAAGARDGAAPRGGEPWSGKTLSSGTGMSRWDQGAEDDAGFAASRDPQDAVSAMEVPPGFSVDLITSEPDLAQPIAMCFDGRGRIWVAEGHTYPVRAPEGQGRDRILILEDGDGDGTFETRKVFADQLNLVSGLQIGFGGVWVGAAPYLLFIPDTDGDDVPDAEPRILLDGWGYEDTHETLNSFTWGPDGWLYGCHGVFTHSRVGKPGTANENRVPLNAGIWRYHPTRHQFEVFGWGGSNPWGIDYNDYGDWFMECCVIPHLFHVIQGARYHRQAGQHFNPYVYEDLPTIADHLHYGDGSFGSMRDGGRVDRDLVSRTAASTSMVGGGHAHCGMAIYLGDSFPDSYYGDLFFHNLHGHRIVRDHVSADGSGYVGHHRPDLVRTKDHAFVGVTVMLGADGSLYFSDWHDPQTCHHRDPEIWDRSNGRIFRLRYGEARTTAIDLVRCDDSRLIESLTHQNATIARQAAHQLHQRSAAGTLDRDLAADHLSRLFQDLNSTPHRLRVLWARHCCDLVSAEELLMLVQDRDPYVRGWAIQLFAEQSDQRSSDDWARLVDGVRGESSLLTLRYLASALQRMPLESRTHAVSLLTAHPLFERDKNLPLLVWYAMEPLAARQPGSLLALFTGSASLRGKTIRRSAASEAGRSELATVLAKSTNYDQLASGIAEFKQWLPESTRLEKPANWDELRQVGDRLVAQRGTDDRNLLEAVRQLGVRFGDSHAFPFYRSRAMDRSMEPSLRIEAIDLLRQAGDAESGKIGAELLGEPGLQAAAVRAVVSASDPTVASTVVERLAEIPDPLRSDLVNYLASRPATASRLIESIQQQRLDRSLVSAGLIRQMHSHDDDELKSSIESIWGQIRSAPGNFDERKAYWSQVLSEDRLRSADLGHGRFVYDQTCGNCHKLHGEGQMIGPDLTGSNRRDLNYLLENVLAPNAIIGNAYQMHVFLMDDGRLITGLIREENDRQVRVVMTAGTEVTLEIDAIESRKLSDQSMMPMDQFEKMNRADAIDLVAYLANDRQVSPKPKRDVPEGAIDPGNVVEGEWLVGALKASAGTARPQDMSGFADDWSGDAQLWWTDAQQGASLDLELISPHTGPCDVTLFLTTAADYPIIRARIDGQSWQSADLFSPQVRQLAKPLRWSEVPLQENTPVQLTIEMTGANPTALKRWMLGVDRIEIVPSPSNQTD